MELSRTLWSHTSNQLINCNQRHVLTVSSLSQLSSGSTIASHTHLAYCQSESEVIPFLLPGESQQSQKDSWLRCNSLEEEKCGNQVVAVCSMCYLYFVLFVAIQIKYQNWKSWVGHLSIEPSVLSLPFHPDRSKCNSFEEKEKTCEWDRHCLYQVYSLQPPSHPPWSWVMTIIPKQQSSLCPIHLQQHPSLADSVTLNLFL